MDSCYFKDLEGAVAAVTINLLFNSQARKDPWGRAVSARVCVPWEGRPRTWAAGDTGHDVDGESRPAGVSQSPASAPPNLCRALICGVASWQGWSSAGIPQPGSPLPRRHMSDPAGMARCSTVLSWGRWTAAGRPGRTTWPGCPGPRHDCYFPHSQHHHPKPHRASHPSSQVLSNTASDLGPALCQRRHPAGTSHRTRQSRHPPHLPEAASLTAVGQRGSQRGAGGMGQSLGPQGRMGEPG